MTEPRWKLLRFGSTISAGGYFKFGILLTSLKLGLDQLVASRVFGRPWSPLSYALTGEIGGLFSLDNNDQTFYAMMLALALPFLMVGVVLTVRRLRDAEWPLWLAVLFFAPTPINMVFFIVLCLAPSQVRSIHGTLADAIDGPEVEKSNSKTGRSRLAYVRALVAVSIPLAVVAAVAYFGTYILRDYGWSLFIGLPFVLPMLAVVIYGYGREVTPGECVSIGLLCLLMAFALIVATAFEGLICIVMMLPLSVPVVMLGTMVGYFIVSVGPRRPRGLARIVLVLFALLPTMVGAEHVTAPLPLLFTCETSVEINAPPEKVWQYVVSFSDLEPPTDLLFRSGVAYPIRARIEGSGVGAVRRCEFSTGTFVEPIEVWDEPRLLRFAVTSNPAPMQEWNPLFDIHPPHLDGFLVSKQGQFLLTPRPGGKTLLKGSTLYQHGLWPASYWRLWSDPIIHRIHNRVLSHIKTLAESSQVRHPSTEHLPPIRIKIKPVSLPGADRPVFNDIGDDLGQARGKLDATREALQVAPDSPDGRG